MKRISPTALATIIAAGLAYSAAAPFPRTKYTVQVPGGLAFSEFRGYEDWPVISISDNSGKFS